MRARTLFLFICTVFAARALAQVVETRAQPTAIQEATLDFDEPVLTADSVSNGATDVAEPVGEPGVPERAGVVGRGGRWRIAPHLWGTATYDDNIFIQPNDEVADYIFTIEPGLAFGFWDENEERAREVERQFGPSLVGRTEGSLFLVDYTAIGRLFARTTSQSALDHDGRVEVRWQGEKLRFGALLHLESKSETNIDIGDRVRRRRAAGGITAAYQLTEKSSLGLGASHTINDPENFDRTTESRGEGSFDYAATPLVRLGLGLAGGEVDDEGGAEQVFERVLGRAAYSMSEKMEATFRGGVEFRQSDGRRGDAANPIFEVRAEWRPAGETHLALEAFRRVETSALQAEDDFTLTGFGISARGGVRGGFHISLDGGYRISEYGASLGEPSRTDRYYFVRPGLFYNFASWQHIGVTFEHRRNNSDRAASDFTNKQISVQVGLQY